eukprot:SAG31_NODE_9454_length_1275_cov_0.818878_2_plen_70_part_00
MGNFVDAVPLWYYTWYYTGYVGTVPVHVAAHGTAIGAAMYPISIIGHDGDASATGAPYTRAAPAALAAY